MPLPKISVVTITYNHEEYIPDALRAVLEQKYNGTIEFILSNDCSTDKTDSTIRKFFEQNELPPNFELKYTSHPSNLGVVKNFSWAMAQVTGKYIALCDGDDYWTDPLKLQKQVDFLEANKDYVLVSHKSLIKDERGLTEDRSGEYHTQSLVFRNIMDEVYTNAGQNIVGDTFLKYYLMNFGRFEVLGFIGGVYRITGTGAWTEMSQSEQDKKNIKLSKAMMKYFQKNNFKVSFRKFKELNFHMKFNLYKSRSLFRPFNLLDLFIQAISLKDLSLVKSVIALELNRSDH